MMSASAEALILQYGGSRLAAASQLDRGELPVPQSAKASISRTETTFRPNTNGADARSVMADSTYLLKIWDCGVRGPDIAERLPGSSVYEAQESSKWGRKPPFEGFGSLK